MQLKNYEDTINWLFKQFPAYHKIGAPAYKPTLDNCRTLCLLLGNPEKKLQFIHVAGTNGKGSTSSMLASILTESGYKTGLFTSPHIQDFRERIRVDGIMLSEQDVVVFCLKIIALKLNFVPSFFEITVAMAFDHFKQEDCEICVIETGLGGRLDATNVITPILSIITNIGLEHTNFLGNTLEKIALEKAGIIKKNVPVVIGEALTETKPVFEKASLTNNSLLLFSEDFNFQVPINFPFLGDYQEQNYKTIRLALKELVQLGFMASDIHIDAGLANIAQNTGFRARLQVMGESPLVIFDVSHNYDGIQATLNSLTKFQKGTLHIVYGTSSDKDLASIFSLFSKNARYYFTEFDNERSSKLEDLQGNSDKVGLHATFFKKSSHALKHAQITAKEGDTILVFGSFFLISDFF
jgi:dihydrofolate synthase/folylpolyglutamate synthase